MRRRITEPLFLVVTLPFPALSERSRPNLAARVRSVRLGVVALKPALKSFFFFSSSCFKFYFYFDLHNISSSFFGLFERLVVDWEGWEEG